MAEVITDILILIALIIGLVVVGRKEELIERKPKLIEVPTTVKRLIITTLCLTLWVGFIVGSMPPEIAPLAMRVLVILIGALYIVFLGFYLLGKRWAFMATFITGIVYLISYLPPTIIELTTGHARMGQGPPITTLLPQFTLQVILNLALSILTIIFSYKAYREFKS